MGTTTFSGPVRSEKGFKQVVKNATTGVVTDYGRMDSTKRWDRYYLEEYYKQKPALNAALDSGGTTTTAAELTTFAIANKDFETLGTNYTTALTTFAATSAGILMTTATADQDQALLLPHLDTNQTAWSGTKWGTENQVEWECSFQIAQTDNEKVWCGLKLTNDQLIATDANQAFFKFATDATNGESLDSTTKWHFVHSIADTDYISVLPVTVAANTPYHFRIKFDSDRKMEIFLNGVQYDITTTSGSTGGTAVVAGTAKSAAMTNDVDLIPYIGIENGDAAAAVLNVHYQAISRYSYE
tara:strand:+ start:171 stop:1067 length:897 start_codon:yes stop_codon:yes gene_type:complete